MNKFKIILSCIFIVIASYSYADCPSISDISIQDNHFVAPGLGGIWRDSNPVSGHRLPIIKFMGIWGVQKPTQPDGVVYNVRCFYEAQDQYIFELRTFYDQTYKINMTPRKNWTKNTVGQGIIYTCGSQSE